MYCFHLISLISLLFGFLGFLVFSGVQAFRRFNVLWAASPSGDLSLYAGARRGCTSFARVLLCYLHDLTTRPSLVMNFY